MKRRSMKVIGTRGPSYIIGTRGPSYVIRKREQDIQDAQDVQDEEVFSQL